MRVQRILLGPLLAGAACGTSNGDASVPTMLDADAVCARVYEFFDVDRTSQGSAALLVEFMDDLNGKLPADAPDAVVELQEAAQDPAGSSSRRPNATESVVSWFGFTMREAGLRFYDRGVGASGPCASLLRRPAYSPVYAPFEHETF